MGGSSTPIDCRRREPARVTRSTRPVWVPLSASAATVSPVATSWSRRSRRIWSAGRVTYEPRSTMSVPRFRATLASVSEARLSASERESSTFIRPTFSPGIVRSRPPAASSVVSISASAVESHAASRWPERFLKPSTATERRPPACAGAVATAGREAPRVPAARRPTGRRSRGRPGPPSHRSGRAASGAAATCRRGPRGGVTRPGGDLVEVVEDVRRGRGPCPASRRTAPTDPSRGSVR